MAIDLNNPLVNVVITALHQYVIDNPDATLDDCIAFIMSYDLSLEIAQEAVGLIADKFEEMSGVRKTFEEIKQEAISAANMTEEFAALPTIEI